MANEVVAGAQAAGAEAEAIAVADFAAGDVEGYDALAFGCPAMGDEELEDGEFQPVWDECVGVIGERPVALFGSYDWGTGDWMDTWREAAEGAGISVVDTVIANLDPDDEAVEACQELGRKLVG